VKIQVRLKLSKYIRYLDFFEDCAICNIITEYVGKSYLKEYSIFVPDD